MIVRPVDAQRVVAAVDAFKFRTGAYPLHLEEAGVDANDGLRRWMLVYGFNDKRIPWLSYSVPFAIFDQYNYDFDRREWTYLAD